MVIKRVLQEVVLVSILLKLWVIPQTAAGDGTQYWDIPVGGPSGPWDLSSSFWSTNAAGGPPLAAWSNGETAVFAATNLSATGNYTVTLAANVTVRDLTYTGGNLGSTLQIAAGLGNTIHMADLVMNVTVNQLTTLTVAPAIAGNGSLVVEGGTLVLTGANTYTGGTTINTGTLQLGNDSATGSIVGAVVNNDTFNIVNANTAGITTITNNFGTTNFFNTNTAGTAAITDNGGVTAFFNTSTAGLANITNNGGFTEFFDTSTAGHASITTNGGGFTEFFDTSTAANGELTVNSGGETEFNNASTAGNAAIVNNTNGVTNFNNTSTAAYAAIADNGGVTNFNNTSTAGNATIANNDGGRSQFFDTSTAGNATIITNSGGLTLFFGASTGGQARFITNAGGIFDISNLISGGMTTGSIEGAGTYLLGSKALTVGLNNRSTEVTGTIADSETVPAGSDLQMIAGRGGSLIKVGTGTLTLTGNNTYSGGTSFNGGILAVNTDANLGTGGLSFNGGTLEALAAGGGIISSKAITLNSQGGMFLADSGTTSNLSGAISGVGSLTKSGLGTLVLSGANTYAGGTTISAGTLQLGNGGATGSIVGAVFNDATFNIFNANTAGITTITNNSGATNFLNASTAGTAAISNNNNGITNFNNTSTAGNATIANNDGGRSQFFDTSTAGNATIITNSGGLTLFFGASTGGQARFITNAGGIFNISNLISGGMTTGSIEGAGTYLLGSKALTVGLNNRSTEVTGTIADSETVPAGSDLQMIAGTGGSLIKVGTGTLTLTGNNTYSGGTSFNGGILAVNTDANLGTGGLSFNGGTLEALAAGGGIISSKAITLNSQGGMFLTDSGTASNLSGAISGVGSLTKNGLGALALSGDNTYTGGTVLNAGTLRVNSAQALGLGNVVVNGGTLTADPQPINVKGNYAQNAGGTLQLQVAGAAPGQYDSLNVGGNAALGGTLQLVSLGFQPQAGNQLKLLTAGGTVSGSFAQFVDPFATGPGYTFVSLLYAQNSVLLEFRTAASFARTPNQLAAANIVDAVHLDPRAANLLSFLRREPFINFPGDFEKISPNGLTSFYEISFSNANIQRLNLEERLDDLRNGSNGFNSNMKVNGAAVNLEDRGDADGKSSKNVVEPILQHAPENRWGVWVTGFGDFVSVDADGNARGYDFTTGGVSLGVDYRITDQFALGVIGDYSHTWTSLNSNGHIDVDSGRGGLYATWSSHRIYVNGAIYGGHNNYDSSRSGLGGLANGGTEGAEWSTFVSGGYDFHLGSLTVGPIAALQYTSVNIDDFTEKGSLAPLAIHSGSAESLRSDVGFRLFYAWQIGKIILEPSLKAAWEHEYKYSALPISAGFAGISESAATFFGPNEGHDSAVVSAGVSIRLTPAITTYVNYDGQLGRQNYDSNAVAGGVRISF